MSLPTNTTKINNLISGINNLPVASEYTAGTGIDITNNEISLDSSAQTSLGLADTALQSVPAGYATETYVDTAIATAIGNAIGGSY